MQAAIDAAGAAGSGPVVVCAGHYAGNFAIDAGVDIVGAGDGDDPSTDTILDARKEGRALTLQLGGAGAVTLAGLRITGGGGLNSTGGGILIPNFRTLMMTRCTVSENETKNPGNGGGIVNGGSLTLTDCRIENNTADDKGGGIHTIGDVTIAGSSQVRGNTAAFFGGGIFVPGGTLTIDAGCQVTGNTAPAGFGGGIYVHFEVDQVTLASEQIVTNNIGGNCAGSPIVNCVA